MSGVYLGVFAVYLVYTVLANRRADIEPATNTWAAHLLQAPLFFMGCYLGYQQGVFSRDLVSAPHIAAGLVGGHLIFSLSLLATHNDLRDASRHFLDLGALWRFLIETPGLIMRFGLVSFTEEVIYRVAAQTLLIAALLNWVAPPFAVALGVIAVAAAFSAAHWHFFRNPVAQSAEFVVFAVLLGAVYYATESLVLVTVIHAVRNLEIVYLEYLVQADECGDEAEAIARIQTRYEGSPREQA